VWLAAAAQGQDVGLSAAPTLSLARLVESTVYEREYAATRGQIEIADRATDKRYRKLKQSGKLDTVAQSN
jgi:hypothetical protein